MPAINFCCEHCRRICDWTSREPVDSDTYKTVGNRFCNRTDCIDAEAVAHGIDVARVLKRRAAEIPHA